jgi:hypothetical protein
MVKMDNLPYDIIYYINNLLDPHSYISFLETGLINNRCDEKQYWNKKKEYFSKRNVDIDEKTIFLNITNLNGANIRTPGHYVCIGDGENFGDIIIGGNGVKLDLNKKIIKCYKNQNTKNSERIFNTIMIRGKDVTICNGSIEGCNTILIFVLFAKNITIHHINFTLFYDPTCFCFNMLYKPSCLYIGNSSDVLVRDCVFSHNEEN